jgi:uncharacterized PurR-regulated membrane protein YhhQ (DUF165 family)
VKVLDRLKNRLGLAALALYIGSVFAANWLITHVGHVAFPGGPHTIPVGFGYDAPSGVLAIGAALLLRDVVQTTLGKKAVVVGVLAGAALSYGIAPAFAFASGAAFLISELLDFAVYTPLIERGKTLAAVVASNTVGAVVDTFLFLWIAFGSIQFWQGQIIGKMLVTLAVLPLLALNRRQVREFAVA